MAGSPYIVTQGIVLRETQTKESDKILTLLTPERGKLSVIARGVRRKSCRYAACAQALVWSEWTLYHRGDWYYVNEGATLELFSGLREDLEAMALGFYFAELTEAVTAEEVPAPELTRHLLNGLYAISTLHKPLDLVKPAFELRLLCLAGYEPLADTCAYCGREEPEDPMLDVVQGVLRCRTCGARESALSPLCAGWSGGTAVHAPVRGLPGGLAAYCIRRSQAAVQLPAGRGGAGAAPRRSGGIYRGTAGARIPDPGLLQGTSSGANAVEIEYNLWFKL